MNIQGWFPLGLTALICLQSEGLWRVCSKPQFKSINSSMLSFLYSPNLTSIHEYWENHSFDQMTYVGKVISLLFNMLPRLVIAFLPRSKRFLISWLQLPSAVILEPNKIKSVTFSIVSLCICHGVIGPDAMILVFRICAICYNKIYPKVVLKPCAKCALHRTWNVCSLKVYTFFLNVQIKTKGVK